VGHREVEHCRQYSPLYRTDEIAELAASLELAVGLELAAGLERDGDPRALRIAANRPRGEQPRDR
jgi:hypothetical protein